MTHLAVPAVVLEVFARSERWEVGFAQQCRNGVELHKQTYYELRARYPELPAQLVCASRVKATEAVKSALDRLSKGRKTSTPHSRICPIRYDQRSSWVK